MSLRQDETTASSSNRRERCEKLALRIRNAEYLINFYKSEIQRDSDEYREIGNERVRARIENGVLRHQPAMDDADLKRRKEDLRQRIAQAERDINEQSQVLARAREEATLIGCR